MNNLEKFIINSTNEFHVLRHFNSVDDSYKKTLLNKQYWYYDYSNKKFISSYISKDDIEFALETIGTKFYSNIPEINNPKKLLELIKEKFTELSINNKKDWISEDENKRATFTFKYDIAVGKVNVLSINNLAVDDRKTIKLAPRSKCRGEDRIMFNIISGIELPSIDVIRVEIFETTQLPFYIITAYPDCASFDKTIIDLKDEELVFAV